MYTCGGFIFIFGKTNANMLSLKIKFKKNNKKNKKLRHHFANKCLYNQSYGFSSSHVWV